jgi:hypothetical protein
MAVSDVFDKIYEIMKLFDQLQNAANITAFCN